MPNIKNLVYNLPILNKYRKKLFKNDEKHTFSKAEFTASTLRFLTMCTATPGDGNDVNMVT